MKDYQRLTVKNVGRYTQIKDDYSTFDCLRRLAELEDKIENGTLVELPCKAGDIVYFASWYRPTPRIDAFKVDHLELHKNYICVACYDFENEDDYSLYRIDSKDISFTKDEALKKLKELKRNT